MSNASAKETAGHKRRQEELGRSITNQKVKIRNKSRNAILVEQAKRRDSTAGAKAKAALPTHLPDDVLQALQEQANDSSEAAAQAAGPDDDAQINNIGLGSGGAPGNNIGLGRGGSGSFKFSDSESDENGDDGDDSDEELPTGVVRPVVLRDHDVGTAAASSGGRSARGLAWRREMLFGNRHQRKRGVLLASRKNRGAALNF